MVSSIILQQSINCFIYNYQLGTKLKTKLAGKTPNLNEKCRRIEGIRIKVRGAAIDNTVIETVNSPTAFPFFQTDSQQEDTPASKHSAMPLKVKRLARDPERFMWAVSMAQTRHINFRIRVGTLVQNANMFAPYADMLNHSCKPNCFFHWRFRDRMFEVMTNAGQEIKKGEELGKKLNNGLPGKKHYLNEKCTRPAFPRNGYEKRNAQTLANKMISLCVVPILSSLQNPTRLLSYISNLDDNNIINEPNSRRKLLNMSMLIMLTAPFTSTCLASPQTQDQQQEKESLDLERYTDIDRGFTLLRPASWIKVEKAGATLLFEDPIKGSNNIGVVVTPVRLNTLREFGDPQFVSNKLIQAEKRKESTKDVEIVSFTERPGNNVQVYEFEYKLDSTRGGLKTIFSAAFVASTKLYLLNIAHSDNPQQPLSNQTRLMLQQVLHSFDVSTTNTQV